MQCQYCSVTFTRKDNYKRHLKVHGDKCNADSDILHDILPSENHVEFEVDNVMLNERLVNFKVVSPDISSNNQSPNFIHPFTCKVMGPRGSGKTSFTVAYLQQIASVSFKKIFIVTTSPDQLLYIPLKENRQVFFIDVNELEHVVKSHRDILVVLDDVMKEARFSATLEKLYTRGRHQHISVISIEQDLFYSNHIERRNADYFVLTRIRDTACLQEFYRRYCRDIEQWRFIELYEMAVKPALGYIVIDLVCPMLKYRINSLNIYFNGEHQELRHIL